MKKLLSVILIFILTGCSNNYYDSKMLKVYTSFYAMYDFAKTIAGKKADVISLIPSGLAAHDWEPGTQDIIGLNNADVFIINGMGMEAWSDDIINSLDNDDILVIEASDGVMPLDNNTSTDPHIWLNPQNAITELYNICKGLSAKDPENAEYYHNNYNNIKSQIEELDKEFSRALEAIPEKELIVTHGAFAYLFDAYGLKQYTIEGISGESDPSSSSLRATIDYMRENNKNEIFYIKSENTKLAETIAKETGASIFPLNPFEKNIDQKTYIEVMRENMNTIKEAFTQ